MFNIIIITTTIKSIIPIIIMSQNKNYRTIELQ